jgi:hypothetical protein
LNQRLHGWERLLRFAKAEIFVSAGSGQFLWRFALLEATFEHDALRFMRNPNAKAVAQRGPSSVKKRSSRSLGLPELTVLRGREQSESVKGRCAAGHLFLEA